MANIKRTWELGSVFAVPLSDGTFTFGQVLEEGGDVITAGFFATCSPTPETNLQSLDKKRLFSILEITCNHLEQGEWKEIGKKLPVVWKWRFPNFKHRLFHNGVGSKSYTSALVQEFINAYFGLIPWNHYVKMPDNYFDGFLLNWRTVPLPRKIIR